MIRPAGVVYLFAALGLWAAEIRVESLTPTVLFPNREPLRQVAILRLHNGGAEIPAQVVARIAGQTEQTDVKLAPGSSSHRILVPEIGAPATLDLEIRDAGARTLAAHKEQWKPQRRWKVYIMKSSHEDLGYENYIYAKQRDVATYIDLARDHAAPAGAPGYRYTMESLLFQRNYIEERGEQAWRRLVNEYVKNGRMGLIGAPHGVHAHWMDYEELVRMTYPGRREARDRFGLDLKTFLIVDNPSLSWSGCQAIADAGYKYMARWGQSWRTGGNNDFRTTGVPAIFWWVAPDRKSRVLYAWRSGYGLTFWFGQARGYSSTELLDAGAENVNRMLQSVENGSLGPYPYDALVNPEYTDHEIPMSNGSALSSWRQRYRYPEILTSHPEAFFEYMEKKYGETIPSLSGDLNNFSADYATIDPLSQGWKRRAARVLPLAEAMGAVAGALDRGFLSPASLIDRTFTRLFDYDEHSWPTLPPANDFQLFNAQWVKQHEAARALEGANRALDIAFGRLAGHIPTGAAPMLAVFNPLAHPRTDLVRTRLAFEGLTDPATGQPVPVERLPDGDAIFLARDVPAFGYKTYRLTGPAPASAKALIAQGDRLANQFYEVRFDLKTGAIRSIFDKELGRDLVDTGATRRFNQLVFVYKNRPPDFYRSPKLADVSGDYTYSPPAAKSVQARAGATHVEMVARIEDPKLGGSVMQTVTLYDGLRQIDIVNDLRAVKAMHSDRYEDRYRANIYYAFPVKVEGFEARVENAGGVVRPYEDQLRWGSHDYLIANRWVDVSNSSFGVTMAPHEASTVSFGDECYNKFSIDYRPANSHLYSYAWSNRMAGLLTFNADDANAVLRYSFTSHTGNWNGGAAARFGWSIASPLEARLLPAGQKGTLSAGPASLLSLDAPNVQLVTLKESEQPGRGWIVRLVETDGKPAEATLAAPRLPATSAALCDLVENDRGALSIEGGKVRLKMSPFSFATVRLFDPRRPAAAEGLQGQAISDSSVRLRWKAVLDTAYNIFRSEDPDAPPTAYTLAARSLKPEFVDSGLKLDTRYYYHVAAVSPANSQGPVSARVAVQTARENVTPPAPVEELGVVRRAKDRLIVYWRKSPDPDIARFLVYRGERAGFATEDAALIAVVRPGGYFLETYDDAGLTPGKTYYYRVLGEDWAGRRQTRSAVAKATTPAY